MRPIETLLSLANLLTFWAWVIPLPAAMRWMRSAALIALLVATVQLEVEGQRWQMIPAYILTVIFFLIWLSGIIIPDSIHTNRFITGIGIGLGASGILISIILPILVPVFRFPQPTGPYGIGTTSYHWVDTSRPEFFTADPLDHRELMAQIWYPAKNEPTALYAPYIQDADAVTPVMARMARFPDFLFTHFKYVTTNAVSSAPIASDKPSYPVLIFLSGRDGFRAMNTFQIEELVSHGYIVVGLDQPGAVALVRFPDGRRVAVLPGKQIQPLIMQSVEPQPEAPTLYGKAFPNGIIPEFAQDVSFTLDQLSAINTSDPNHILTGQLDLGHVGAFGISLGGMTVAEACLKDSRLKACLIMDVYIPADVVKVGLEQPSMLITRDADTMRLERQRMGGWAEQDITLTLDTMRTVYENLPGDGYYVEIPKVFHLNFTDVPHWSPITSQLGLTGPIDAQQTFDIINTYSVAFFDKHLKGRPSTLLNGPPEQYPDVNFETRRPQ
ncbi:MAG: carboxylic ester hydrolase [Anaerolineae bacterium]|nr:carboxylic ester hydrolase [Anaerolineae bacterium]